MTQRFAYVFYSLNPCLAGRLRFNSLTLELSYSDQQRVRFLSLPEDNEDINYHTS